MRIAGSVRALHWKKYYYFADNSPSVALARGQPVIKITFGFANGVFSVRKGAGAPISSLKKCVF